MAELARVTQKIFGINAPAEQIAKFGSLAAGSPVFTTDPGIIQALSQFEEGWTAAVIGGNSPTIEDMNALFYLCFYQLHYIFQKGIPEWDAGTTYYSGSFASYAGDLYQSLTDNNLNNVPSTSASWKSMSAHILSAKFTLEDASVPFDAISGPHFQSVDQTIEGVAISMLNSGRSGTTQIRVNVYRGGALFASATAEMTANASLAKSEAVTLSAALSLQRGDIITCDLIKAAKGKPSTLSVEYFGGNGIGGSSVGSVANPAPFIYELTALDVTNKGFTLPYTPTDPTRILIDVFEGNRQFYGLDYIVGAPNADDFLTWNGFGMESIVESGMKVLVTYSG